MSEQRRRSSQVAVRLTPAQRITLTWWGRGWAAENPDKSYEVLNAEGEVSLSAVVRKILGDAIDGFRDA